MKNIKIILLVNIIFMIIESSKIVKSHFVSFIFLGNAKDRKIQNTKDVFLYNYEIQFLVIASLVK